MTNPARDSDGRTLLAGRSIGFLRWHIILTTTKWPKEKTEIVGVMRLGKGRLTGRLLRLFYFLYAIHWWTSIFFFFSIPRKSCFIIIISPTRYGCNGGTRAISRLINDGRRHFYVCPRTLNGTYVTDRISCIKFKTADGRMHKNGRQSLPLPRPREVSARKTFNQRSSSLANRVTNSKLNFCNSMYWL